MSGTGIAASIGLSPEGQKAAAPDIAVNSKGEMAVLWVDRAPQEKPAGEHNHDRHLAVTDVYVAVSRDGGQSFTTPVKVNASSGAVWGQQVSRPRVVGTPNGTWHISYAANDTHPKLQKTLLTTHYTRSIDGGRSFESPKVLSAITDQDMSGVIHGGFASAAAFGTLVAAPDGSVHVYWIDTRHMQPDSDSGALYGTSSQDDGKTFATEKKLIDTGVCPCCQLTAVATARSEILLGSRRVEKDSFRPATIMTLSRQDKTLVGRQAIGGEPWQIAGCPLKPTVTAVHDNRVFAAVHNGGETTPGVIFSVSTDSGQSFKSHGIVHSSAAVSDAPTIAVNGSKVLLAWHAKVGSAPRRVFYRLFDLSGEAVGDITELDAPPGIAQYPAAAVRPDGNFQLVWQQADRVWATTVSGQ
ncbi:MAG: exo-alpha-sialidase [Gammaproteobacteria bacterium]|nr:exo-alpha-sialidase [Gammaproteobacteria bacterium]